MTLVCSSNLGWLISHSDYTSTIHKNCQEFIDIKTGLFEINAPYVKKNSKRRECTDDIEDTEVNTVQNVYNMIFLEFKEHFKNETFKDNNQNAVILSKYVYEKTSQCSLENIKGMNNGPAVLNVINGSRFLFPENCRFYCKDVLEITENLYDEKFDLILLDPPWWNKYIRRKRKKTSHAYNMMYNSDLKEVQIENLLGENGLVAVWCTNSAQHITALKEDIFPKWGIRFTSKWYWLKVTQKGVPVCNFSNPPGKQPYEQIIFGCHPNRKLACPSNGKMILSVPSALHSHKPPLTELLKIYLPVQPKCLEIFARYLLPNWTSYGNEVLKFQHESLYEIG
ncbi:hypothetical protein WA026_018093 [Henosepilachna vigintioctopunctata]|uniref:Methyltransferase-like protein 4 n=1 Tax=Henosepilachna vigintioctopunctata TaxID=420089 RepID=A0AAW1UPJ4_9CUCU